MHKLTHFRLCPFSRSIRLLLAELQLEFELIEERPWEWRPAFLALNPAGDLPLLQVDGGPLLVGAYAITEYWSDTMTTHPADGGSLPLFPGTAEDRSEVRRLVDWSHRKLEREVTRELLHEKLYARLKPGSGHTPDLDILRAIRANLRYTLGYFAFLTAQRRWLAGEELSFADLAAGAHLSTLDYFNEVPWEDYPAAKAWYVRLKSRRAFRGLLSDRIPGTPPPAHYADLDF